jgi:hypothetical protein
MSGFETREFFHIDFLVQVVKRLGCAEKLTKGLEARLSGLSAMQV